MTRSILEFANPNVKYYGAVGNGSTDDTTAIRTGLTAVSAAGGGVLMLPVGIYVVREQIIIPPLVELHGYGKMASKLRAHSEISGAVLKIADDAYAGNTTVRDLAIVGQFLTAGGIEITHTQAALVEGVDISGCSEYGIKLTGPTWINTIRGCVLRLNGRGLFVEAVDSAHQVNAVFINDCLFVGNVGAGARLIGGTNIKINQCTIELNGTGGTEQYGVLQTGGTRSLAIRDSYFERNGLVVDGVRGIGVNIRIGDANVVSKAPMVDGCYLYGGENPDVPAVGECTYAIELENTVNARVVSNHSSGHTIAQINKIGSNEGTLEQCNNTEDIPV